MHTIKTKTLRMKKIQRGLLLYFSSILLYSISLLLFNILPFYTSYLSDQTFNFLIQLFIGYIILAPIYYLLTTHEHSTNKTYLVLQFLYRNSKKMFSQYNNFYMQKQEKVALLFILVKLFFLPLMFNFFFNNMSGLEGHINNFQLFSFALFLIFTLDTLVFAFGYTFEFASLKNKVKSVEPTFLGWFVTLICYPPFNGITGGYIPWGANDYALFWNDTYTNIARIVIVVLLSMYLAATFALGAKASNLTNRGIVSSFPYSVVRHPAYISKVSVWWITLLPFITWPFALGMFFWTVIYGLRAITEERHLNADSDYLEYKKKVKYRFIPYIF